MTSVLVAHEPGCDAAVLTDQLLLFGYDVVRADGGFSALEVARSARPDAAVVELAIGGYSALKVAKALRSQFGWEMRLVGFTLPSAPHLEAPALAAGYDHVVVELGDASEVLLALGGEAADLVARTRRAQLLWNCMLVEHGFARLGMVSTLLDAYDRRRNVEAVRSAVGRVQAYVRDRIDDPRIAELKFRLALLEENLRQCERREAPAD